MKWAAVASLVGFLALGGFAFYAYQETVVGPLAEEVETPALPSAAGTQGGTGVTRAELSQHNTRADCWVAYKGVVYDLTKWLPRHPGPGAEAIAPHCGTAEEFERAFTEQHGKGKEARLKREGVFEGTLVP